jgi:NAD+ kinase
MKIHFISSASAKSLIAFRYMVKKYGQANLDEAEYLVVLSGDGVVLRAIHDNIERNIPIYGMNRGGVGFLTNLYRRENLIDRIHKAQALTLHPLRISGVNNNGSVFSAIAVNELYMLRQSHQSAKICIKINDIVRLKELICDGIIAATSIGSTAYNYSARGPIIPVGTDLLALTPISPFRPRGWGGALLKADTRLSFEVIDEVRRPVCSVADYVEFREVSRVSVYQDTSISFSLLFDEDNNIQEKMLNEQFSL